MHIALNTSNGGTTANSTTGLSQSQNMTSVISRRTEAPTALFLNGFDLYQNGRRSIEYPSRIASPRPGRTGEAPCGAHVFEGFFGLENGPVKSDKSQEQTLFGKDFPKPAKTQS